MGSSRREDPRLQESLDRLRALGYLRSPAELFVADKVTPRAGILRTSLVSGAWIGLGGGFVAGVVLAISVLAAVPELLSQPRDLAWLSFDLVLVSAVGAGLLVTLLTSLLLSWKRRRKVPWREGAERFLLLIAVLPPALYLSDVFGRFLLHQLQGRSWWLGAVAAAIVATILAVAWGRLLRGLLASAGLAALDGLKLSSLRGIRFQIRGLVLLSNLLLLFLGPYREMRALPRLDQVPPREVAASNEGILLITLDGIDELELSSPDSTQLSPRSLDDAHLTNDPVAFWNSLATGFEATVHGLESASAYAPTGVRGGLEMAMRQPVLAGVLRGVLPGLGLAELRVHDQRELLRPPLWEIAAHCGRPSSVINAWASYPAAQHPELSVLSDRCFLRMWEGERVDADPHLQHPLRDQLLETGQAAIATRVQYPSLVRGDAMARTAPQVGLDDFREAWEFAVAADLFHAELARRDHQEGAYRLVVLHLGGADILERSLRRVPEGRSMVIARRLIDLYHEFMQSMLSQFIGDLGSTPWVVVSSHGSRSGRSAAIYSSEDFRARNALQVAPELLRTLGVPPARDMRVESLDPSQLTPMPSTWGRRASWTPAAMRSAADLERLRSLGYIGGQ